MALSPAQACHASTFSPSVFGAEILDISATLVSNYSASVPEAFRYVSPAVELQNATFCNITVSYTHPGQDDKIVVESWLPNDSWNGRLQAIGGGGWVAGRFLLSYSGMLGALADGFATVTSDAGLGDASEPSNWALLSQGNVNVYNLQNLASVSLNDEAIIAKSLIKSFYGREPEYSYWNGCSQGGRQGLMLAQRYPTAYDGIAAGAPAILWTEMAPQSHWAQQVMNELQEFPYPCEFDALTAAAVRQCDGLDGVADGIVADVRGCLAQFDPFAEVGKPIQCAQTNTTITLTGAAAIVANATWHGMQTERGKQVYHGVAPGSDLTGTSSTSYGQPGLAMTECNATGCTGAPTNLGRLWLQLFVAKDADKSMSTLTRQEFDRLVYESGQQYRSTIGTADPDLTEFRDAGGKLVTFHGLADNIIPPGGTEWYYNAVADILPDVQDFYRYFEAPGLGHCFGGLSGQPTSLFKQLQDWVEKGTAPDQTPIQVTVKGKHQERVLCPYPQRAAYQVDCGDVAAAECWQCVDQWLSEGPGNALRRISGAQLQLGKP